MYIVYRFQIVCFLKTFFYDQSFFKLLNFVRKFCVAKNYIYVSNTIELIHLCKNNNPCGCVFYMFIYSDSSQTYIFSSKIWIIIISSGSREKTCMYVYCMKIVQKPKKQTYKEEGLLVDVLFEGRYVCREKLDSY